MPLKTWLKIKTTRLRKKPTSFRTEACPPPLSRGTPPRLRTPNYTSPSCPRPQSRPVSPRTRPYKIPEPASPISSKGASSVSSPTVSPLTPPESAGSEEQSWITRSESSPRGSRGSDIRLHKDNASIGSAVHGESTLKQAGSPDEDSDGPYPPAGRKEELVELFTLHGPVYGEEWRLREAYDNIEERGVPTAAEDIESVNEELMDGYTSGYEGCSGMWTVLLEGG
ncbi:hypothetical protein C7212DRAFT_364043 [Tuber magnatum]|uniref:Uncharacterized protein n=1 Tax=Tuber magnatum TaxID=42249 RepID=A0A317SS62_9PEZI|nr:hypothetical protein C7212DRAFT_364043 [Tuber magnatum]